MRERRRVCFVEPGFPGDAPTGPRRAMWETARELARGGHDVHVAGLGWADGGERDDAGVMVHRARPRDTGLLVGRAGRRELAEAAVRHRTVAALHASAPFDVVVVARAFGEGVLCALDAALPTVVRVMTPADPATQPVAAALEHALLGACPCIHAASEALATTVRGDLRPDARVTVVPLGVADRGVVRASRPSTPVTVLFVGRLEPRKGIDVLLAATRRLLEAGAPMRLVVVGPDADGVAARTPADHRITFTGEVDDETLARHHAEADVLCAPSRYESFGNVFVEAHMRALPVASCSVGGIPEVVSHGTTGLLVPPGDVEALAGALRVLVLDADLRSRMGAAARRRYREHFDIRRTAPATLAAYLDLLARASAPVELPVRGRTAALVAAVADVDLRAASGIAGALLTGTPDAHWPADAVRVVWTAPPERFTETVFAILLGRAPSAEEQAGWLEHCRQGGQRLDLVLQLQDARERVRLGAPDDWLPALAARLLAAGDVPDTIRAAAITLVGGDLRDDQLQAFSGREPADVIAEMAASSWAAAYRDRLRTLAG